MITVPSYFIHNKLFFDCIQFKKWNTSTNLFYRQYFSIAVRLSKEPEQTIKLSNKGIVKIKIGRKFSFIIKNNYSEMETYILDSITSGLKSEGIEVKQTKLKNINERTMIFGKSFGFDPNNTDSEINIFILATKKMLLKIGFVEIHNLKATLGSGSYSVTFIIQ
jgi:hypothetical protein